MSNEAESGYYQLSDEESVSWKFAVFVLFPMALVIGLLIIGVLFHHLRKSKENKENAYYIYAIKCAAASAFCTVIIAITAVFFSNNYFIDIDYSVENNPATLADSILNIVQCFGKVLFYFGFTFHFQSLLNEQMPFLFKLWMGFVAVLAAIFATLFIYDDISVYSLKEVGVTSRNDVYLSMFLLQEGTLLGNIVAVLVVVTDLAYFIVLAVYYILKLKKANRNSKQGVKGLILLFTASAIWDGSGIFIAGNVPIKYIFGGLTVLVDDCCLFLMFKFGDEVYSNICGCLCHNCCARLIYGSKYQPAKATDPDDVQPNTDTDALL